jgi:beta-galactosidase
MRSYTDFNDGWVFHEGFSGQLTTDAMPGKPVRLPHTAVDLPFS